jgi:hypothetical protein
MTLIECSLSIAIGTLELRLEHMHGMFHFETHVQLGTQLFGRVRLTLTTPFQAERVVLASVSNVWTEV